MAAGPAAKPTIVLVHGAWADASSWDNVIPVLLHEGYTVDAPPNPLRGLSSDSAYLASYSARSRGLSCSGQADGYHVVAPQFPMTALADDVGRLRQVLAFQDGPTIVAGHSYGGQIMTALGTNAPNVVGLVYIAAFGLDEGESLGALLSQGP